MTTEPLNFDLIVLDGGTQSRVTINQDTVDDYAEIIAATKPGKWPFPPLDVFFDGTDRFMSDGFHRLLGAKQAGRVSAPCVIHKGTAQDARIFGMTANDSNGLRMTRADKRACVEWLLDNGGKIPQQEIAAKAGVSVRLVKIVVAERKPKVAPVSVQPVTHSEQKVQFALLQPVEGGSAAGSFADFDPSDWPDSDEETAGETPQTTRTGTGKPPVSRDYGKCPACAGTKWTQDEKGVSCRKCHQPYGEPAGDVDKDRLSIQRSKTVKTVEALMRAFDDLQVMRAKDEHEAAIDGCKALLRLAKAWK